MKFGVNTLIWSASYDDRVRAMLPTIKQWGFDGIEVPAFRPLDFPAGQIRKDCRDNGLACTVISVVVQGLSLISDDAALRSKTRQHLSDAIQAAAEAGSTLLAGPLYSPVGYFSGTRRTDDEWKRAVEGIQSLTEVLEANDVTLAIEPLNRFETYFLNTAADAAGFCDAVDHPRVGLLIDTFHANIEEKHIAPAYRTASKHLKHVHTCENDRGIPGSGHIDWVSLFDTLHEMGYDNWLTIESFGFALGEISAAASIWRDIERSPDVIASEGIQFLKSHARAV
jgi:D-psicose/D-tagatose/L-ribulose 3-epimerase